jgi:hypothetical protein
MSDRELILIELGERVLLRLQPVYLWRRVWLAK